MKCLKNEEEREIEEKKTKEGVRVCEKGHRREEGGKRLPVQKVRRRTKARKFETPRQSRRRLVQKLYELVEGKRGNAVRQSEARNRGGDEGIAAELKNRGNVFGREKKNGDRRERWPQNNQDFLGGGVVGNNSVPSQAMRPFKEKSKREIQGVSG